MNKTTQALRRPQSSLNSVYIKRRKVAICVHYVIITEKFFGQENFGLQ